MAKRYDYGDVYYTKAEVDAKVSALATGLGDVYYTKAEVDAKVSALATGLGDVYYTKAEVDAKVSALATGLDDNVVVDLAQGASINLLQAMLFEGLKLVVVPGMTTLTVAEATGGASVVCDITAKAGNLTILPANWDITVTASISDTTPALDEATVSLVNGATTVTVTVPAGTYEAGDTITVSVADYTLPSGVKVTGTAGKITIVANAE